MRKTRFLTRLAATPLVVAVATGTGLLIGGVANAAPSPGAASTAIATATTLMVAPSGSFPEGLPVTLIATVTPPEVAGAVRFKDGDIDLGEPVPLAKSTSCTPGPRQPNSWGGWGLWGSWGQEAAGADDAPCPPGSEEETTTAAVMITWTLPAGPHSFTAEFTPTDPSAFESSISETVPFTVTPSIIPQLPSLVGTLHF